MLALAVSLIRKLGAEFLPQMNEGDIHVTVTMPSAVSLERGAEVLRETRLKLLQFPEVKDVLTEQGHPEDGTDDEAPNQAETFVIMKPETEWHTGRSKEQIVDAMRAELEKRPGVVYNFSQPIKDRVEESISGIRGQIVVKIYGEDLQLMHEKLEEVNASFDRDRGARDVEIYRAGSAQHVVADIDREAAARYGVAVRDVEDALESGYGGRLSTSVWEGERKVGVRVKLPVAERGRTRVSWARLRRSPVRPERAQCRWRRWPTSTSIAAARRSTASRADASWPSSATSRGATWARFVDEAQERVRSEVKLPEGYYMTWGGEFENQRRAMKRLAVIVPISILVIFALLYLTFRAALPAIVVLLGRAVRDGGRRVRAVPDAHRAVGVGGGRLHHPVRRGGHGRRLADHLRAPGARAQPGQRGRHPATRCRSGCGRC